MPTLGNMAIISCQLSESQVKIEKALVYFQYQGLVSLEECEVRLHTLSAGFEASAWALSIKFSTSSIGIPSVSALTRVSNQHKLFIVARTIDLLKGYIASDSKS